MSDDKKFEKENIKKKFKSPRKHTRFTHRHHHEDIGIPEPERITIYDVVMDNFKKASRITFLHRLIFVAEHTHDKGDVQIIFENLVETVNQEFCFESLTGFLLIYDLYFTIMLEGDEDTINHFLIMMYGNPKLIDKVGNMKVLLYLNHIYKRFSPEFHTYTGTPPALLEKIDPNTDVEGTYRQILTCLKKLYCLIAKFVKDLYDMPDEPERSEEKLKVRNTSSLGFLTKTDFMSKTTKYTISRATPHTKFLPECYLLEFLINSNITYDLGNILKTYGSVRQKLLYEDKIWPVPKDFVPYDMFERLIDPVTDLPTDLDKEDEIAASKDNESLDNESENNVDADGINNEDEEDVKSNQSASFGNL